MAAFVIQYDLNRGKRDDYDDLYDALLDAKAVRATESTWFLSSTASAIEIRDWLQGFMHSKDVISVNVLTVGSGYASDNLPDAAVKWMAQNLKARQMGVKKL
jgi:hypothetical protein